MASAIIHLAVAKKLLDYIKVENKKDYLLGSIAPDISKQIGSSKVSSHFLINTKPDNPFDLPLRRSLLFRAKAFLVPAAHKI